MKVFLEIQHLDIRDHEIVMITFQESINSFIVRKRDKLLGTLNTTNGNFYISDSTLLPGMAGAVSLTAIDIAQILEKQCDILNIPYPPTSTNYL